MNGKSLRIRLLLSGLGAVLAALAVAGIAMTLMFERHVERRAIAETEVHLRTLLASAALDGERLVFAAQPADPRFAEAYSGLYWQAQRGTSILARSRSLWDTEIALPPDDLPDGGTHIHVLKGPRASQLLAVEHSLILTAQGLPRTFRIVVAQDRNEVVEARDAFALDLAIGLLLLGAVLLAASIVQVMIGLRPLGAIRQQLMGIRSGTQPRLPDAFPAEVTPLASEINALLDERDIALERARGRAADLAHGLKTPLTALAANVRRLRDGGQEVIADEIDNLGALMQRHVQRELARARVAHGSAGIKGVPLRPVAEQIAATVARTREAGEQAFDFDIDAGLVVPIDRADLEEVLGNLVENAARYARQVIRIAGSATPQLVVSVCDDGAGLDQADRERLLRRGERLDQSGAGAGLGLSIVSDIAEAYGVSLRLSGSDLGGLCVALHFPVKPA